uniref:CDGSH iron-sulfur domain-containing protein 1-like n=1 Tax=Petromyzon marinus TaxID=7757 RepID=A0AAJ7WQ03_PETMA|nr:CDGSH iron-sulfur domain-containing protein 1-like [Petromyzon marinus]
MDVLKDWNWAKVLGVTGGVALIGYLGYKGYKCCHAKSGGCCSGKECQANPGLDKDNPKVVHAIDVEDLGEKAAFCRCWRSKKFPYCDGAHAKHNETTGDNVGPLIINNKKSSE